MGKRVSFQEESSQLCWGNIRVSITSPKIPDLTPSVPHFSLAQRTQRKAQLATGPCEFCGHPGHVSRRLGRHIWAPEPMCVLPGALRGNSEPFKLRCMPGLEVGALPETCSPGSVHTAVAAQANRPGTRSPAWELSPAGNITKEH